jgi:hypothetical protein
MNEPMSTDSKKKNQGPFPAADKFKWFDQTARAFRRADFFLVRVRNATNR